MHWKYEEVTIRRSLQGKCSICGKRTTRQISETHTVNPFNRNKDGSVKTRDEVHADVSRALNKLTPDFDHAKCKAEVTR